MNFTKYMFFDPYSGIGSDWEEVNRLMGRIPRPFHYHHIQAAYPPAHVSQTDDKVKVSIEFQGLKEKVEVKISIEDNVVYVKGGIPGKKKEESYAAGVRFKGGFSRAIPLPAQVEEKKAKVKYRDGVLTIEVPKLCNNKTT